MSKASKPLIKLKLFFRWLDDHLLLGISLFLLAFIPLYPKWPLFDVLPGYIVRIRLEDFLILSAVIIWFIYVLRRRVNLRKIPLFKPIGAYLVIGFLSVLSGIFITKTIYPEFIQIAKAWFHYFRRIEYFSLFFIFFSGIRNKKQIKFFFWLLPAVVMGITIYGYGQKYLYWPAYSTMNREFSKGMVLYLTKHARVLSTFGGHYDLAAYIMLTLPILISLGFLIKNKWFSSTLFVISLTEFWLLILTASRTSFVAYLAAITVTFGLLAMRRGIFWSFWRWGLVVGLSVLIMTSFGDLSERFAHILQTQDLKARLTSPFKAPPVEGVALDESLSFEEQLKRIAAKSDVPPTAISPDSDASSLEKAKKTPLDVYPDFSTEDASFMSSEASKLATGSGGGASTLQRDYSENALKYGLSTGIRLDALWPRAWEGFKSNPLLGSGYSTLVKTRVWEFTQAESTDNDYLRLLGETGLLGFITFFSIFAVIIVLLFKALQKTQEPIWIGLFAGGLGITVGLLVNALYIDVFESSKVAYTYWSLMGILLAMANLILNKQSKKQKIKG